MILICVRTEGRWFGRSRSADLTEARLADHSQGSRHHAAILQNDFALGPVDIINMVLISIALARRDWVPRVPMCSLNLSLPQFDFLRLLAPPNNHT